MAETEMKISDLKNRARPYLRVACIALLLALLIFGGIRVYSLHTMGNRPRNLILINPWNPLSETGYTPRLTTVEEGIQAVLTGCAVVESIRTGQRIDVQGQLKA